MSASRDVLELLAALHPRNMPGRARVLVGRLGEELGWYPGRLPERCWPDRLLEALAGSGLPGELPPDLRLCAATIGDSGLLNAVCAWAELPLPATFDGARRGRGWHVPAGAEAEAMARLQAFPLRPSVIVHQAWSLWAGWLLPEPLGLDRGPGLARLERAQRGLAEALGGLVEEVMEPTSRAPRKLAGWSPARCSLRLPGSRNYDAGGAAGGRVRLLELEPSRRYGIDELLKTSSGKAAA